VDAPIWRVWAPALSRAPVSIPGLPGLEGLAVRVVVSSASRASRLGDSDGTGVRGDGLSGLNWGVSVGGRAGVSEVPLQGTAASAQFSAGVVYPPSW